MRLPRLGFMVTTENEAQEALETLSSSPETYDWVLADYNMPGLDGLAVTRILRERGYEHPVILMAGFQAQVSEEAADEGGVDAALQKPLGRPEPTEAIAPAAEAQWARIPHWDRCEEVDCV